MQETHCQLAVHHDCVTFAKAVLVVLLQDATRHCILQ